MLGERPEELCVQGEHRRQRQERAEERHPHHMAGHRLLRPGMCQFGPKDLKAAFKRWDYF